MVLQHLDNNLQGKWSLIFHVTTWTKTTLILNYKLIQKTEIIKLLEENIEENLGGGKDFLGETLKSTNHKGKKKPTHLALWKLKRLLSRRHWEGKRKSKETLVYVTNNSTLYK